jgi:Mg-chelatase subunit ChlD
MRLTLRTLIAFRDQVLPEHQQNQLAARIQNADFAQQILSRFEDVTRSEIGDELLSLDANVTANYLDSSMSVAATQRFEEVAITNDDLLSEVAECHRILASHDARRCDNVVSELRHRLYQATSDVHYASNVDQPLDMSEYAIVAETEDDDSWLSMRSFYGPVTSAVVNATLLILLSLLSVGAVHKAIPIELSITDGKPDEEFTVKIPSEINLEIESKNFANPIVDPMEFQADSLQLDDHFFEEANRSTLAAATATDFSQFLAASGNGNLGKSSAKPSIRYYGQEYSARDVVYVVDASGSMRGPRFRRACEELLYSLNHLDASQQFAILFFSGNRVRAFPHGSKLFEATRKNITKAQRFIVSTQPQGGTEPSKSLINALSRNPELIFFLSDGEIPDETVTDAKNANVDLTVINTIGFENRYGATLLRALAEQNRGEYRFVP